MARYGAQKLGRITAPQRSKPAAKPGDFSDESRKVLESHKKEHGPLEKLGIDGKKAKEQAGNHGLDWPRTELIMRLLWNHHQRVEARRTNGSDREEIAILFKKGGLMNQDISRWPAADKAAEILNPYFDAKLAHRQEGRAPMKRKSGFYGGMGTGMGMPTRRIIIRLHPEVLTA